MQGPLHHGAGQDLVPAALCLRQGGVRHLAPGGRLRRGTGWGFFLKKIVGNHKKVSIFFRQDTSTARIATASTWPRTVKSAGRRSRG